MLRRKPIAMLRDEAFGDTHSLKRALGPFHLILLGIGAIIGAGIFTLTGTAAASHGGPAIALSFAIAAVACCFAGLCYAEFASMIPIAGSAYTYAFATMGELVAWIIGWDLILEYAFASSAVAISWSGYVVSFLRDLGIIIPPELTQPTGETVVFFHDKWQAVTTGLVQEVLHMSASAPIDDIITTKAVALLPHTTAFFNLPAALIILFASMILIIGIKESATVNAIIVFLKVSVILTFVVVGAFYIDTANWTPFIPANTGKWGEFGISGLFAGAATIFFAYIGFDAVSTAAQESKNPQRDMPIGILGSLVICTILFILVSLVLTGIISYTKLNVSEPIALGIDATGNRWLSIWVKIAAIAGLTSVILVLLLGQSRIFFSMSRDGLLPPAFSKTHKKFHTPYFSTALTGLLISIAAATLQIHKVAYLVNIGTLFAFVLVCGGVLVLRYSHPEIPRHFRVPGVHFVSAAGILSCAALMLSLPAEAWSRLFIWMGMGMVIYLFYGRHRSRLNT